MVSTVYIPSGTFKKLPVPAAVTSTGGMTPSASWTAVDGADSYAVRLFPLNGDGNPDTSTLIYDSGRLFTTSHTLLNPDTIAPGCYALCIESWDFPEGKMLNRSRYFTRISIGDSSSVAFADLFVIAERRIYDSCFTVPEGYYMIVAAMLSSDAYNPHPVRVQWNSEEHILTPQPGWSNRCNYEGQYAFVNGYVSPAPGPDWETIYTFTVDCDDSVVSTVNIPENTFHQLSVPDEVTSTGGVTPSASWTAVDEADSYAVRLFPLNDDGNPNTGTVIYDSGRLFTTSHTLTDLDGVAPGCYALCIESREYLADRLVNRSRYFTRVSVESQGVRKSIDFNADGIHDIALFYPDNHKWYIKDQISPTYGTADCLPIPGDYDGGGTTDLAVVDLTRGDNRAKWYLDGVGVFIYGLQEWIPVSGDYDGDGITDAALFDPATGKWYIRNQFVTTYGAGGIPVPGDYNGDGITDIAVFNPANNKWYIKDIGIFTYGMADCIPVPADYDGDGITDLAVIDTSRPDGMAKWYIRNQAVFIYGAVDNTIPVPGDYDGDGDADPCLFYQNTGKWYCRNAGIWSYGNGDMIPLASNLAIRYAMSASGDGVW